MQQSLYHIALRTAALTLALVLLFDSGIASPLTKDLSQNTQAYLAQAIGMYAGVEATELSEITAGLTAREQELNARESALTAREISVDLENGSFQTGNNSNFILSVLVFILLVLIVLNYILDFIRGRSYIMITKDEKLA